MGTVNLLAVFDTWTSAGHSFDKASQALAKAADQLCDELTAAGSAWGDDDLGQAFFNGGQGKPGFGSSRDQVLPQIGDMVNVLAGTGDALVAAGAEYLQAEHSVTRRLGGKPPGGASTPATGGSTYHLPPYITAATVSDPPPGGLVWMMDLVESLVAGCTWPDGSTGALGQISRALSGMATALGQAVKDVSSASAQVLGSNVGQGAENFGAFARVLVQALEELQQACQGLASSVDNLIAQKQAARIQFIASMVFLVASFFVAQALAVWTLGGSEAEFFATAEAEGWTLRMLFRLLAKGVLEGLWYGAGMDAISQVSRIITGAQHGWNWAEFGKAAGEGAVAGAVMSGLGGAARFTGGRSAVVKALFNVMDGKVDDPSAMTRLAGFGTRVGFNSATGFAGNVASQAAFDDGNVNWTQAGNFAVGMAVMGEGINLLTPGGRAKAPDTDPPDTDIPAPIDEPRLLSGVQTALTTILHDHSASDPGAPGVTDSDDKPPPPPPPPPPPSGAPVGPGLDDTAASPSATHLASFTATASTHDVDVSSSGGFNDGMTPVSHTPVADHPLAMSTTIPGHTDGPIATDQVGAGSADSPAPIGSSDGTADLAGVAGPEAPLGVSPQLADPGVVRADATAVTVPDAAHPGTVDLSASGRPLNGTVDPSATAARDVAGATQPGADPGTVRAGGLADGDPRLAPAATGPADRTEVPAGPGAVSSNGERASGDPTAQGPPAVDGGTSAVPDSQLADVAPPWARATTAPARTEHTGADPADGQAAADGGQRVNPIDQALNRPGQVPTEDATAWDPARTTNPAGTITGSGHDDPGTGPGRLADRRNGNEPVRDQGETGPALLGGAGNGELARLQRDLQPFGGYEHLPTDRAEMAQRLDDAIRSGVVDADHPGDGMGGATTIVKFADGTKWVRKRIPVGMGDDQDAEELTSYVSDALGAGAPTVIRTSPDEIWMPFVDGRAGGDVFQVAAIPHMYGQSERGTRIGVLDYIVHNAERNPTDWITGADGLPVPFDHGYARFEPWDGSEPFGFYAVRADSLSPDQWDTMQRNLEALEPVFAAKGRQDWHQNMMDNLADLRGRAAGDSQLDPPPWAHVTTAPARPEHGAGDFADRRDPGTDGLSPRGPAGRHHGDEPVGDRGENQQQSRPSGRHRADEPPQRDLGTSGRHEPLSADRTTVARRLERAMDSGIARDTSPGRGDVGDTRIVEFRDGSTWVRKRVVEGWYGNDQQDREELTSHVSDALGAGAPTVIRTGRDEIYMPFVRGKLGAELRDEPGFDRGQYTQTDRGLRIGMLDYVVDNSDRNPGNWIVGPEGQPVPIDHGGAQYQPRPGDWGAFRTDVTHDRLRNLPADEWDTMRRNLDALEPVFAAKGRQDWYETMMDNFAELRSRADTATAWHREADTAPRTATLPDDGHPGTEPTWHPETVPIDGRAVAARAWDPGSEAHRVTVPADDQPFADRSPAGVPRAWDPHAETHPAAGSDEGRAAAVAAGRPEDRGGEPVNLIDQALNHPRRAPAEAAPGDDPRVATRWDATKPDTAGASDGRGPGPTDQPTRDLRAPRADEPAGKQHDGSQAQHEASRVTRIRDRIITRLPGHPGRAERANLEQQLHHAIDSGVKSSDRPGVPGTDSATSVVEFNDGTKWVRKLAESWGSNDHDAEEITSYVSDALGAGAPTVIRTSPNEIYMPFVEGTVFAEAGDWWNHPELLDMYTNSARGLRIGIMDFITNNTDRNPGNWIVGTDGQPVPIDHGRNKYGDYPIYNDTFIGPMTPDRLRSLPRDDWDTMQQNLEALKRVFRNKGKLVWYNTMMRHFAELRSVAGV